MIAVDAVGKEFSVGQTVARAAKLYKTDGLYVEVVKVTKVVGNKVYLNDSLQPLKFPDRVAIVGG